MFAATATDWSDILRGRETNQKAKGGECRPLKPVFITFQHAPYPY